MNNANNNTMYSEIKAQLAEGQNFQNDNADWYTINGIKKSGGMFISVAEDVRSFRTLDSFAKAVKRLINTGR